MYKEKHLSNRHTLTMSFSLPDASRTQVIEKDETNVVEYIRSLEFIVPFSHKDES